MSEQESGIPLFHITNSKIIPTKISLKLLSNGHIHVDWKNLPRHEKVRQCVIHYKSLNNNRSEAIRVSRKEQNIILRKILLGHLYEIQVCTVDHANRVLASSERTQIQTKPLNEAPILRVTKSTPDFIWLEWKKSEDTRSVDIESYRLNINGQTIVILPATENKFVVNEGKTGRRYVFQLEMTRKDGKVVPSVPISIIWPGVTIPEHHVFINGCEELIICWGDSKSINDGNIESYTLHLYDSEQRLLNTIGPNPPECHQVWIQNVNKGVYFYVLEIKLAHSKKLLSSKPTKIECGRETRAPILTCHSTDSQYREKLSRMAYRLIKIRDNMKSNRWQEKCDNQLKQILSIFTTLTDSLRLNLTIESKSNESTSTNYRLIVNEKESSMTIPGFVKNFPLELPRQDQPYELYVLVTPDSYETKSNKVLIEASGHFSFFCAHFHQQRSIESCSYIQTLAYEKQVVHQGQLKTPEQMTEIQVYDFNENRIVPFPSHSKAHRLSIVFFYLKRCVPSMAHLNYFSTYASSHRTQYNYISINCDRMDLDELKELTQGSNDIQHCTDFAPEEFQYKQKGNDQPIHELLSLDGVPTYFLLNFTNQIVWKGRLCIQDQSEYDRSMDHIIAEFQQQPCSSENCELCSYRSMNDTQIGSEVNLIAKDLQSIIEQQSTQTMSKQQDGDKQNRTRRVFSMKKTQEYK